MEVNQLSIQMNTSENTFRLIENMTSNFEHSGAIIYRKTYLGKNINMIVIGSNDIEEIREYINKYKDEFKETYTCTLFYEDGIMLDETCGCMMFKQNCKSCIYYKNNKDKMCEIFNCEPKYVTYVCFNYENFKEKVPDEL